ncbi:hypothetical protein HELRODRAFT_180187 [Helobdella robusta]|uniref:ILEI/PANDER domain-containing protein n=1 Tax=Helobdella robusta TaxID=6412 RepID=T1FFK0_HELRO|nr:hypothetical protein HELRODRAFT_180187 [Helobdella robusta]ESN94030.1 hypothetical protein HELRODRAFT_180187 [Helobdella robusta]
MFPSTSFMIYFLHFTASPFSAYISPSSNRIYYKLMWRTSLLCSNSSEKTLEFNKSVATVQLIDDKTHVGKCALKCQTSSKFCFAFQVNVMNSAYAGRCNVFCYHFADMPDAIFRNLYDNCSLYLGAKPIYMNVSSWGFNDLNRNSPGSNAVEILWKDNYYSSVGTRGVFAYKLNMEDHTLYDSQYFAYYTITSDAARMKNYLQSAPNGTVVIGRTGDEPYSNIALVAAYLKSVNLDVSSLAYRGKWLFVWQQGAPEKTQSFIDSGKFVLSKQFLLCNIGCMMFPSCC